VKEAAVVGVPDAARGLWLWCAAVGGVRVLWCGRGSGLVVWWEMAKCANDEMEERVELPFFERTQQQQQQQGGRVGEWAVGHISTGSGGGAGTPTKERRKRKRSSNGNAMHRVFSLSC
jgi:hypothetical protein